MLVWFAETTIVAGILALVAIAASRLRPIAPSVRHALWLVVLIKFVTPPLVSWPWAIDWRNLSNGPPPRRTLVRPIVRCREDPSDDRAGAFARLTEVSLADDSIEQDPQPIEIDDALPADPLRLNRGRENSATRRR